MKRLLIIALAIGLCIAAGAQQQKTLRVACLGDSITYGGGKDTSWPSQLGGMLGEGFEVRNFGRNGATCSDKGDRPYRSTQEYADLKAWLPDVVTIMLGTNDTKNKNWISQEEYTNSMDVLIREVRDIPSHPKIFMVLAPPVPQDRFTIRDSVIKASIIPAQRYEAKRRWMDVVDVYSALLPHPDLFADGVHPKPEGYTIVAREVYKMMETCGLTLPQGRRVVLVGDSITDGFWGRNDGHPTAERNHYDLNHVLGHGYAALVASMLGAQYPEERMRFYNRGISGDTLKGITARWDNDVMTVRPDVISIFCGINDSSNSNQATFDLSDWEKRYRALIDRALEQNPEVRLVLCTPFYGGEHPFILQQADIVRKIAADYGITCVDFAEVIYRLLRNDQSGDSHYWLWDRIHPTYPAHYILAQEWVRAVAL